jgi:hypothetical protein
MRGVSHNKQVGNDVIGCLFLGAAFSEEAVLMELNRWSGSYGSWGLDVSRKCPSPCGPNLFSKVEPHTFKESRVAMVRDYTYDIMMNFHIKFVSSIYWFKFSASIENRPMHLYSLSRQYQL